jgi:hypothetical protein
MDVQEYTARTPWLCVEGDEENFTSDLSLVSNTGHLVISEDKKRDLLDLLNVAPVEFRSFYKHHPCSEEVTDCLPDTIEDGEKELDYYVLYTFGLLVYFQLEYKTSQMITMWKGYNFIFIFVKEYISNRNTTASTQFLLSAVKQK